MVSYAGIDLGKRKSLIRVITAEREMVEGLKIENDPKEFARIFQKYLGRGSSLKFLSLELIQ